MEPRSERLFGMCRGIGGCHSDWGALSRLGLRVLNSPNKPQILIAPLLRVIVPPVCFGSHTPLVTRFI